MANAQPQAPQGGLSPRPQQPKDATPAESQPVFRDWAAI